MLENMENLKIIDILRGESIPVLSYNSRFSHGLSFKRSGETLYRFEGRELTVKAGELVYIPKGSTYTAVRMSESSEYVLINFDADIDAGQFQVFPMDGYPDLNYIYDQAPRLWRLGDSSEKYRCYSIFYSVLSFIIARQSSSYAYITKFDRIAPAVEYLRAHIFDCDLRVEALPVLCGVSDTYFRKVFRANFNVSPREYIANKRLDQACSLIINGAYNTIAEVALSVGYSDPLYFSRVYSRRFGHCPHIDGIKKFLLDKDFS